MSLLSVSVPQFSPPNESFFSFFSLFSLFSVEAEKSTTDLVSPESKSK